MEDENDKTKTASEEGKKGKKSFTLTELKSMIQETVNSAVSNKVDEAVNPLKKQTTDWMQSVNFNTNKRSEPIKTKGIGAARYVRALAFGQGSSDKAVHFAKKAWNDDLGDNVVKALQAGDFTAGGALVPPEFAQEIIEQLRARTVIRAAGARTLPMNNGTLTIRKQTGTITSAYVGESQNITKTEPTTGQIVLTAKKLAAIVPISNDLLTYAPGDLADEFVRDDLVMQIAVREDLAFIRDTGVSDTPRGIRYWAQAANVTSTNGTSSANIESDFKDLIQDLEGNNVRMINPVWLMAPRSKNHLMTLRDGNGNLVYPEVRDANPTVHGFPIFVTNNIPTNLGSGSDETEVYLVDMADVIIGEVGALEIAVDPSAAYHDGSSVVSAFSRDETVIRAITRHDLAVRHNESVALKSDVAWGA